jgi:VWFA-related protein
MRNWVCVGLLVMAGIASAQDEKPEVVPVTPAVTVPVLVRDHKGEPVQGLAAANFTIKVDGKAQPLSGMTVGVGLPVTYGLVVDVGNGQRNAIEDERKAARAMVALLKSGDQMFVVHFARQIELLQGPTADKAKLEKAIGELGTASPNFQPIEPAEGLDSEGRRIHAGGTSLNDALFLSSDEVLAKTPTKRVLLVMSDGVDNGSKTSMGDTMDSLEKNNVLVYTMYSRNADQAETERRDQSGRNTNPSGRNGGIGFPGGGGGGYPGGGGGGYPGSYPGQYPGGNNPNGNPNDPNNPNSKSGSNPNNPNTRPVHKANVDGKAALEKLSLQTGGREFDEGKKESMEADFAGVTGDLQAMYWLNFTPQGAAARHGYHQFDLTVAGSDKSRKVDVQTTDGYYGG